MKVIFLDFDGVINNWNSTSLVDKDNVLILKKIIDLSKARVVVTSSVKYSYQRENKLSYCDTNFYRYNIQLKELGVDIMDVTPYVNSNRTMEIKRYLMEHTVENYVILDDEIIGDEFIEHQVYLDLYKGLEQKHIKPVLNILNGKLGFYPNDYDRSESEEKRLNRINNYYNSVEKR